MPMEHPQDHDLLIRLDQKVETLIKSVDVLTNDHEARLRSIEKYVWKALGGLTIIDVVIGAYLTLRK